MVGMSGGGGAAGMSSTLDSMSNLANVLADPKKLEALRTEREGSAGAGERPAAAQELRAEPKCRDSVETNRRNCGRPVPGNSALDSPLPYTSHRNRLRQCTCSCAHIERRSRASSNYSVGGIRQPTHGHASEQSGDPQARHCSRLGSASTHPGLRRHSFLFNRSNSSC